jgi:phosphoribosylaminoimidazole carboxylase
MSQFEAHLHAILDLPIPERRLRLREPAIMLNILGGNSPKDHLRLAQLALTLDGTVHLYNKGSGTLGRKMGHITITAPTMREAESIVAPLVRAFDAITGAPQEITPSEEPALPTPVVAVVMGSDTDLKTMEAGICILEKFGIPHIVRITSAHRTPDYMAEFAARAAGEGIKVIIAGGLSNSTFMFACLTSFSRRRCPSPRHGRRPHSAAGHRRPSEGNAP